MKPIITELNYTYKKEGTDIRVLNTKDIPIPKENSIDTQFITIPPENIGGNHKHPRTEYYIGMGSELELVWINNENKTEYLKMNPEGQLLLIEIPPMIPHAVVNKSKNQTAFLIEYANDVLKNTESVKVV